MSRDYTQLRAFNLVDEVVVDVYVLTRSLPEDERYGLQAQLRRAAVSAPANIVEGSVRRSDKAYLVYLETSLGSACEVRYLLRLAVRLGFLKREEISNLEARYSEAIRTLQKLIDTIARAIKSQKRRTRVDGRT
jgi:four helix bundle protein